MGIANNHADVGHWWGKPGTPWGPYTMDRLRADISGALGLRSCFPYFARVVTDKTPLGVWSIPGENAAGRISLGTVPKGDMVQVVGSSWLSGWYLAMLADGRVGHSNGKYLLPMEASVDEEQPENLASVDTTKAETFTVIVPDVDADAVSWLLENYSGAYTLPDGAGR